MTLKTSIWVSCNHFDFDLIIYPTPRNISKQKTWRFSLCQVNELLNMSYLEG